MVHTNSSLRGLNHSTAPNQLGEVGAKYERMGNGMNELPFYLSGSQDGGTRDPPSLPSRTVGQRLISIIKL